MAYNRSAMVRTIIYTQFLETREPITVSEIAELTGFSPNSVRFAISRIFAEDNGWIRIQPTTVSRAIREKDYGTVRSHRQVAGYMPTIQWLADIITGCVVAPTSNQEEG